MDTITTILQIDSSVNQGSSASRQLAYELTSAWQKKEPDSNVVIRDLAKNALPHIDHNTMAAFQNPEGELNQKQQGALELSNTLIEELRRADILVTSAPLYNLSIPSSLKAWFDHVMRARETFIYTGPGQHKGLLENKKAYVISSRGGAYENTTADLQTPLIRSLLAFIGIEDIEFIYAEGLAYGNEHYTNAMASASEKITTLVSAA
ncbi:FMN-dependent NADH-azoreductase [Parendozoicomonas haliclonae]|uniref:FMN dependent NADH:quinone oxidoreductase n=1 Tax=Parendozoicomonas haliclonae TaxID=1960125 RepID=A0A1X7APG2_9GAMM|nr:NAD(P)H-dependent oxidoreductase [Parendozoicomonas haliclonae]SMA50176.1 FMN-dependent NADH-azoreductase [Parendozoicomonas haliclonae]